MVNTTTLVGGLRLNAITAPIILGGPMTAVWLLAYVQQVLALTPHSEDVVIVDGLPAQKDHSREGCCQSNGNLSPVGRSSPKPEQDLSRDCAPLSQCG